MCWGEVVTCHSCSATEQLLRLQPTANLGVGHPCGPAKPKNSRLHSRQSSTGLMGCQASVLACCLLAYLNLHIAIGTCVCLALFSHNKPSAVSCCIWKLPASKCCENCQFTDAAMTHLPSMSAISLHIIQRDDCAG